MSAQPSLDLTWAATAKLALSGLSTKAYPAVQRGLCQMGFFTVRDLREARRNLTKKADEDVKTFSTPDGWFISDRAGRRTAGG